MKAVEAVRRREQAKDGHDHAEGRQQLRPRRRAERVVEPDTPVFDAYIIAYLWAIGLVCGQNTNITPESMTDRVVSIFVYLFATLFWLTERHQPAFMF